jgi:hypothetical protein
MLHDYNIPYMPLICRRVNTNVGLHHSRAVSNLYLDGPFFIKYTKYISKILFSQKVHGIKSILLLIQKILPLFIFTIWLS